MQTARYSLRLALAGLSVGLAASPSAATTLGPLTELAVGPAGANQRAPVIAWDPVAQRYVMLYEADAGGPTGVDLRAARLLGDGQPVDAAGCDLVAATHRAGNETQAALAFNPADQSFVVAWSEARFSVPDVFVSRFRTGPCAADREAQVTLGCVFTDPTQPCDSDIVPQVGVLGSTVWVAFQSGIINRGNFVRGRRYRTNLTPIDGGLLTLSELGATRPSLATVGSVAALAFDRDADVFLYGLPAMGPVPPPSAASAISMAPGTQSRVRLAGLGGGLVAAWQDNSVGVGQEDIRGRRYDVSLAPVGLEYPVGVAPNAQVAPALDGDGGAGLAVWQDRRNGTFNAIVYGARLDPVSGQVRDTAGFPIIVVAGNAFEPFVARGPGQDFLVAAVRFGTPSRIFYRIVREEPPAGTLVVAPASAPADGMTRAVLDFGNAVGASGFSLVDGTLYTVTLSPANLGTIEQADVDPTQPGLQVATFGGRIRLSFTSSTLGTLNVSLASVEGTSTGSGVVRFVSTPPEAEDVQLRPLNPTSTDELVLTYTYVDPDGQPESGTTIQWTKDDLVQSAFQNQRRIPPSATNPGEAWRAQVRPSDGTEVGQPAFSNTVVILNAPPEAEDVVIEPNEGVTGGTILRLRYRYVDPDNDPEAGTTITWLLNGVPQPGLQDQARVPADRVAKGQVWQAVVRPRDGRTFGPDAPSNEVRIINAPPGAFAGPDQTALEGDDVVLDGSRSFDPDPQDVLSFRWRQVSGPAVTLVGADAPTPTFVAPPVDVPEAVVLELVVSDGEADSNADQVVVRVEPRPEPDAGFVDTGFPDAAPPPDTGLPPIGCAGDDDCPDGFFCDPETDQCRAIAADAGVADAAAPDSGLDCPGLPIDTECCVGACGGGELATPVCPGEGRPAICPDEALLCVAGSCSQRGLSSLGTADDVGCGCTATSPDAGAEGAPLGGLALLALFALGRRQRRTSSIR